MKLEITIFGVASLLFIGLTGCGGGGSSAVPSGPIASTLSFPLQSAYKSFFANGATKTFTVTGSCSGTGSHTLAAATTAATFENVTGFSASKTITMSLSNCTPASTAQTSTNYYDSTYIPLGYNMVGVNYGVYLTPPTIPTSVVVGGTNIIGTTTLYADSTKAVGDGRRELSYLIEADTTNTAIVNIISNIYNAAGTLTATTQDRYRIATTGALTPVSADIQYANGSTIHLVLTYN
jgi:hypothetical protein